MTIAGTARFPVARLRAAAALSPRGPSMLGF